MGLGLGEMVILLVVLTLFFGGKKLPELGKAFGQAVVGFKEGMKGDDSQENQQNSNDNKKVTRVVQNESGPKQIS